MARPSYRTQCPQCGNSYNEDAYVEPDDADRWCPPCLLADTGQFDPQWFVNNPCPFPIGTEQRRAVMEARIKFLCPTHIHGDCEDYDKARCKGIVSKSRSSRSEWTKRQPRTATIVKDDNYDHGD